MPPGAEVSVRACARSAVRRISLRPLLIRPGAVPCASVRSGPLNLQGSGACGRKVVEVRVLSSAPAFAHAQPANLLRVSFGWAGQPYAKAVPPKLWEEGVMPDRSEGGRPRSRSAC